MTKSKLMAVLLIGVVFVLLPRPLMSEGDYQVRYVAEFSLADFSFSKLMDYDLVTLKDGDFLSDLGRPMLPSKELRIALPAGMAVTSVYVTDTKSKEITGEYTIFPAQPPRRIGFSGGDVDFVEPDKEAYLSTQPYPSDIVQFVHQGDLAGQGIAFVLVYPMQYIPYEKRLTLYTSMTLVIEGTGGYRCGDYLSPNISEKDRETYEETIKDMVVNPEDVRLNTSMAAGTPSLLSPDSYGHVIITSSSYVSAFQPLVEWHTKKGVRDTVVTTNEIYTLYSGATNQEKIRNFIIDAHSTWGTIYYLLGGENATVPFEFRTYYDESAPSDQYYSDYDDDWTHEVFVGRFTGTSTGQFTTAIDKVLKYEKDPPRTDYPLDVLLIGMDLDGSTPTEELKQTIASCIPARFNITKVYDSDATNHKTAAINALNAGQNLVNHSDHSNFTVMCTGDFNHSLCINNANVDALTNDSQMSIIVSTGCDPNGMDYSDCIAEHFVKYNPYQAGVAFTGNTRSGWYRPGEPMALSSMLDMQWWVGLFNRNKYRLGQALVDSKHNYSTPDAVDKQCEWVFNLQGEPEMPIWTDEPDSFAVTFSPVLPVGTFPFLVHVEDSSTHSPVYQAYVCLWKGDEVYLTGYTNTGGDLTLNPSPSTYGVMYVTVTKHNYIPYEGEAVVAGPLATTYPATDVEENTATIRGYLENDGGFETTCWLVWDTDSEEPYANSESLGVMTGGSEFSKSLNGLVEGKFYYFKAKANNIAGWGSGEELTFLTKPLAPNDLTAEAIRCSTISLTWSKPESADSIIIERNGSSTWTRGEGTEIYTGGGTGFEDTGLEALTHYYYQAWSYCTERGLYQNSDGYASADAITPFMRGDPNADRVVGLSDVVYLINYLFRSGPAPNPPESGDVNCDDNVGIVDVVYLINYLFNSGPPPC
jgi:hypothetical protein